MCTKPFGVCTKTSGATAGGRLWRFQPHNDVSVPSLVFRTLWREAVGRSPRPPRLSPGSPTGRGLAIIQKIVGHRRDELGPRAPIHSRLPGIASRDSGCDQRPAGPRGFAAQEVLLSEIVRAQPRIHLYEIVYRPASYTPPRRTHRSGWPVQNRRGRPGIDRGSRSPALLRSGRGLQKERVLPPHAPRSGLCRIPDSSHRLRPEGISVWDLRDSIEPLCEGFGLPHPGNALRGIAGREAPELSGFRVAPGSPLEAAR